MTLGRREDRWWSSFVARVLLVAAHAQPKAEHLPLIPRQQLVDGAAVAEPSLFQQQLVRAHASPDLPGSPVTEIGP
jgi:hypothetical protein